MYQFNKKTKLIILLTILTISTLLLLTHSSLTLTKRHTKQTIHVNNRIQLTDMSACDGTLHRDLCVATLSSFPDLYRKSIPQIISDMVNHTVAEVGATKSNCSRIRDMFVKKLVPLEKRALEDCLVLLDYTIQQLREVMSDLSPRKSPVKHFHDLQTLLSAAMTNEATCLDGFAFSKSKIRPYIEGRLVNISHHVSNSLAMLKKIPGVNTTSYGTEVLPGYGVLSRGFPAWIKGKDRQLLQSSINQTTYNLMVAKDGTGNFTTIGEALEAAPNSSRTRFVIYIKAGAYYEYLEVDKKKTNLMFVGDGIGKTLIKGDHNRVDNFTTFDSMTVAVVGKGFIAKGITFENYAGPSKHQAVALRSGADLSAFYQCSFVAYQDTLYVHTLRQFYRECDIYGTVDFIFGNAAVVFQNCNMYARKPDPNQKNVFTAQGRQDPNQNTGISILNCKIAAGSELIPVQSSFKSYLGRPWQEYSRTVFLLSYIGDLIDPKGFLEWNGTFALNTLYYGEYENRGVGSNTTGRVTWGGYKVITNVTEASEFTVGNFIQGGEWLSTYNIPYYLNLTS